MGAKITQGLQGQHVQEGTEWRGRNKWSRTTEGDRHKPQDKKRAEKNVSS